MPRRGSPADARMRRDGQDLHEIVVEERTAPPPDPSNPPATVGNCEVCFARTTQRCKRCHVSHYCSAACQKESWLRGHQAACDAMCCHVHHALIAEVQRVSAAHDKGRCLRFIMLAKRPTTRSAIDTLAAVREAVAINPVFTPFSILLVSIVEKRPGKDATVMMCRAGGLGARGRLPYIKLYSRLTTLGQLRQGEWRKACAAQASETFPTGDCALLIGCVCTTDEGQHLLRVDRYEYQFGLRGGNDRGGGLSKTVDYRFSYAPVPETPHAVFPLESTGDGVRLAALPEPLEPGVAPPVQQHFDPSMLFQVISEINIEDSLVDEHNDATSNALVEDNRRAAAERGMPDCADAYEARRRGKALAKDHERVTKDRFDAGDTAPEVRMFGLDPTPFPAGSQEEAMAMLAAAAANDATDPNNEDPNGLNAALRTIQALNLQVRPRPDLAPVFQ